MVKRASGYYITPFKGLWGVTQGGPISTKMLNIMVDEVVIHWLVLVVEEAVRLQGFDRAVQYMASLLYADDIIIMSTHLELLQWAFDVLTEIIEKVGLKTSMEKMVSMAL